VGLAVVCGRSALVGDQRAATAHYGETHAFTARRSLAGYLGENAELPVDLRGEEALYFITVENFEAYLGHKSGHGSNWNGPGWYVPVHGFSPCGRCSGHGCGHNYTKLVSLGTLEMHLAYYFKEVVTKLRAVRAILQTDWAVEAFLELKLKKE